MWEECLVDLEKRTLVIHKEIQDMRLVFASEVSNLDAILRKLSQPKETLLKLFSFFRTLLKLLELLSVVDLVLKTALHDLFSDFLDALNEERLKFIALSAHVNLISDNLLCHLLLLVNDQFKISDSIRVARFQRLHILYDFLFNLVCGHSGLEDKVDEFLELDVGRRNISVAALRRSGQRSLARHATLFKSFSGIHL